jgi:hypothetical protein
MLEYDRRRIRSTVEPGGVKDQRGRQTADARAGDGEMDMAPSVSPDVLPPGRRWSR